MMDSNIKLYLHTPDQSDDPIFLAGNLNKWKEADPRYQLKPIGKGLYEIDIPKTDIQAEDLEYKYLRNSWKKVEHDKYGSTTPNRSLSVHVDKPIHDFVPMWGASHASQKYAPIVEKIDIESKLPPRFRTRRITALLPHDYYSSGKHYPVMYLQDGQNLFEDYAPFGSWAVDDKMAVMASKDIGDFIVIAIDHAKEQRIKEYSPYRSDRLQHADGQQYAKFLAETLKPHIDQQYRTYPTRVHTGIGGSSMGGLISLYTTILYPNIFGKVLVFSPSLWISRQIYKDVADADYPGHTKIYLYGGHSESPTMVESLSFLKFLLQRKQANNPGLEIELSIDPYGKHNEAQWGKEFPYAMEWLFLR